DEKRNARRLDLDVVIELSRIDGDDGITTVKMARVEVVDLSRSGIGFVSQQKLEVGSFYNTKIQIWTKDIIEAIIKIVRCKEEGTDQYHYGASFVGMIDKDALKIDVYQMFFAAEGSNE
ncbi:MAG: PilZ domain-containing protein, partial [Agathobacter sp.]|nr:PilZ domain-containing protein [Agathobacter sp.]